MDSSSTSSGSSEEEEQMKVFLKVTKTVPLDAKGSDTIDDIKTKVLDVEGVPLERQHLFYGGIIMNGSMTLADYQIRANSTLHLFIEPRMQIFVKIPSLGKVLTLDVKNCDSVGALKARIDEEEGIPINQQELIYSGVVLENSLILGFLNILEGSTLYLLMHPNDDIQVYVKMEGGKIITVKVKSWYTVKDVKAMIESMERVNLDSHKLYSMRKQLEESASLSAYKITNESVLHLFDEGIAKQILVKTWSGRIITVEVKDDYTIDMVMDKIRDKMGSKCERHMLLYAGRILVSEKSLAHYNIQNAATIQLLPRVNFGLLSRILVERVGGVIHSLDVGLSTCINEVKALIESKTGISYMNQCLSYNGEHLLDDDLTLEECGIPLGSKLLVMEVKEVAGSEVNTE